MAMNVLILSGQAATVPLVLALLSSKASKPNLFRVDTQDDVSHLLTWAACDMLVIDATADGYGRRFDAASLRAQHPGLPIVVLDPPATPAADQATDALLQAVRMISPHATLVSPHPPADPAPVAPPSPAGLTGRQHDVLRLLRQGCSTREIASVLGLAVPTVKSHLRALYRHLGAANRLEAVLKAAPDTPPPRQAALRVVV